MKKITFTAFAHQCIMRLDEEGRYSTAHLYKNALRSYSDYLAKPAVLFSDLSRPPRLPVQADGRRAPAQHRLHLHADAAQHL